MYLGHISCRLMYATRDELLVWTRTLHISLKGQNEMARFGLFAHLPKRSAAAGSPSPVGRYHTAIKLQLPDAQWLNSNYKQAGGHPWVMSLTKYGHDKIWSLSSVSIPSRFIDIQQLAWERSFVVSVWWGVHQYGCLCWRVFGGIVHWDWRRIYSVLWWLTRLMLDLHNGSFFCVFLFKKRVYRCVSRGLIWIFKGELRAKEQNRNGIWSSPY